MAGYGFNIGLDGRNVKPLTEAEAEEVADGIRTIYGMAREDMLKRVSNRLGRGVTRPGWAERKSSEILAAHQEMSNILDRAQHGRESLLEDTMARAYTSGSQKFYADMGSMLGNAAHTSPNAMKAGYILADLNNGLDAAHRRILRQFDDKYAGIIGAVSAEMATGVLNTREAVGRALQAFADQGITGFIDQGGHHWTLENYAEMAVLTAIERSTIAGYVDTMQSYGYDLAIIDGHVGACPDCEAWEGVIISVSGEDHRYPSLSEAESDGCFHPRCMHGITTYYGDISRREVRTSPRERRRESPAYTARSKQRYMERQIRKYKDRAIVAQTPQQRQQALNKVHQWEDALDDLIDEQPRENYMYRHKGRERPEASKMPVIQASANMYNRVDPLHGYMKNVIPIPGFEDVGIHGNKYGFSYRNADGDESTISAKQLADILRQSESYHGGDIRLISCEAGAYGSYTAQGLADELGVRVMAPTDVLYLHFDGRMTIGDKLTNQGEWIIFEPRQK